MGFFPPKPSHIEREGNEFAAGVTTDAHSRPSLWSPREKKKRRTERREKHRTSFFFLLYFIDQREFFSALFLAFCPNVDNNQNVKE